eukprot:268780_1
MTQMIRTLTLLSILIFTTHATQSGNKNNGKETCYQNGKTYQDSEIISSSAKCVDDNRLKGSEQVCENGKIKDKTFNHDCGQGYVCCTEDKSEVTCQKGSKCNNNNNDKNNYKAAAYADTNHHKPKGDMCYIGDRTYEDGEHILTIPVACIDDKMYSAQYAKCKNGGIKNKDKIYECAQGLVCCDVNTENEYNIGGAVCLEDCTEEPQACIIDDIKYESGESIHKIGLACSHQIVPDISVCNLPKVTGVCRAAIPRYYYNADTYRCEEFIYGGCNGNENNFETLLECSATCEDVETNSNSKDIILYGRETFCINGKQVDKIYFEKCSDEGKYCCQQGEFGAFDAAYCAENEDLCINFYYSDDDVPIVPPNAKEAKEKKNGDIYEVYGVAEFTKNVIGDIIVDENGNIEMDLDLSNFDSKIDCNENKFGYAICNEYNSDNLDENYGNECNRELLGDLFDPFETGKRCEENDDYVSCEIGDLSGRFGLIEKGSNNKIEIENNLSYESKSGKKNGFCGLRLSPESVYRKSIGVYCGDDETKILFCAPFRLKAYDEGNE